MDFALAIDWNGCKKVIFFEQLSFTEILKDLSVFLQLIQSSETNSEIAFE